MNRPRNWTTLVDGGLSEEELQGVRDWVGQGPPLGTTPLVLATAARLKLASHSADQVGPERRPTISDVRFLYLMQCVQDCRSKIARVHCKVPRS